VESEAKMNVTMHPYHSTGDKLKVQVQNMGVDASLPQFCVWMTQYKEGNHTGDFRLFLETTEDLDRFVSDLLDCVAQAKKEAVNG
jgi:hypothetical protein